MSVKSLLQLILFLLIIIILGGIYYLYFYSGPMKKQEVISGELSIENSNDSQNLSSNQEILEVIDSNKTKKSQVKDKEIITKNFTQNITSEIKKNSKQQKIDEKINNENKINNLTKNIEYITTNKNGSIFKIIADYGKTNLENTNILDLIEVYGVIKSVDRSEVEISSKNAEYNYSNQNSKFYNNVQINYDNKIIRCDNLDLNIDKNIAVAYNNVTVQGNNSFMKANKITLNILTKDINISSDDKIEITAN